MSFKRIIIIIVVIQLFSVISITGFYYMMSPLQNCLRMSDGEDGTARRFCIKNTRWLRFLIMRGIGEGSVILPMN